jgi:outer membrane protein OmpA-like peptidoglycan-associated protein|nr:OmpA family protein [Kofleriaceae bacterium]
MRTRSVLAALVAVAVSPRHASADTWVTAETPAAFAVSGEQASLFRPGVMPALGLYHSGKRFALGLRARAGVLNNGPAPGPHYMDPGMGGLVTGGVALRAMLGAGRDGWLETVVGGGVTGHDGVPVMEIGAGWWFGHDGVDIAPSVRYVGVVASPSERLGSAQLVLVGLDLRFGHHKAKPRLVEEPPPVLPPPPPPPPDAPVASDGDAIGGEALESCAEDSDACPVDDTITVVDDRIVLDDRVFFDFEQARVRSGGRELIVAVMKAWREHPEWAAITVEGHTDLRGSDDYNQDLSQRRADQVRNWMVRDGADPATVDAIGYGRSRPRDAGTTEDAHKKNRRVEFVVHRRGAP